MEAAALPKLEGQLMGVLAGGRQPDPARPVVVHVGQPVAGLLDGAGPEADLVEHRYMVGGEHRALASAGHNVLGGRARGQRQLRGSWW